MSKRRKSIVLLERVDFIEGGFAMNANRFVAVAFSLWLALAVAAPGLAQDTPRPGGVLKAAMIGEPPSLDLHWTTAVITQ